MVWVLPICTLADVGLTLIVMAGGGGGVAVSVMAAAAVLLLSVTDLAVSVTAAGEGTFAGAVYVIEAPEALELDESVPHAEPEQPEPAASR